MADKRNRGRRKLVLLVLGWGFVVLGILGLFLPILQGILFLAVGIIILAQVSPRARLLRQRLRRRYPRAAGVFDMAEKKVAQLLARAGRPFRRDLP
jgi:uncharacterized membrane protein YbaN (DUF454 family)